MFTREAVYPHEQSSKRVVTSSLSRGGREVPCEVHIKLVAEVHQSDHHFLQVINMLNLVFANT